MNISTSFLGNCRYNFPQWCVSPYLLIAGRSSVGLVPWWRPRDLLNILSHPFSLVLFRIFPWRVSPLLFHGSCSITSTYYYFQDNSNNKQNELRDLAACYTRNCSTLKSCKLWFRNADLTLVYEHCLRYRKFIPVKLDSEL